MNENNHHSLSNSQATLFKQVRPGPSVEEVNLVLKTLAACSHSLKYSDVNIDSTRNALWAVMRETQAVLPKDDNGQIDPNKLYEVIENSLDSWQAALNNAKNAGHLPCLLIEAASVFQPEVETNNSQSLKMAG